ncbi:MAG: PilZ domain-containing protein [Deltaproteobacteria bacterium]|nr:PilZ domain-containing protein [Deltaproteobacteria bacterium]
MSLGLTAPCALPVEARASAGRAYRLALHVGAQGAAFDTPLPWEPGTPVELVFTLPDGTGPLIVKGHAELLGEVAEGDGEHGCMAVAYPQASLEAKRTLDAYVRERLGLDAT